MAPEHMGPLRPQSRNFAATPASSAAVKMFVTSMGVLLVLADGQSTSSPTPAPPVQELCTNGVPGIENGMGTVCCPSLCGGICGGTGCEAADVENCCAGAIVDSGVYCDDSETAPCIIDEQSSTNPTPAPTDALPTASPTPAPTAQQTCKYGVPGIENGMGTVCCSMLCGENCGGSGCSAVTGENCCASAIWDLGVYCEDSGTSPCIIGLPTPAPTLTPAVTPAPAVILLTTTPSPIVGGAGSEDGRSSSPSQGVATPSSTFSPSPYAGGRGLPIPPTSSPSSSAETIGKGDVVSISCVGGLLLAVLLLTCASLRLHCSAHGKSIRGSLETLFAKGSFWGANIVLFGLLITLNIYNFATLWGAVSVFGTIVLWIIIFAWFVAFKTGTPATVSLGCPCHTSPCKSSPPSTEWPNPNRRPTCPTVDGNEEAPHYGAEEVPYDGAEEAPHYAAAVAARPGSDLSCVNPDPRALRAELPQYSAAVAARSDFSYTNPNPRVRQAQLPQYGAAVAASVGSHISFTPPEPRARQAEPPRYGAAAAQR